MIIDTEYGDIFASPYNHIVFAVSADEPVDGGVAGAVMVRFWPGLHKKGVLRLGEVLSNDLGGRVFHALACHSSRRGWGDAPYYIERGLNSIAADDIMASVRMGAGPGGERYRADSFAILGAMARSAKKIVLYERD